MYGLRSKNGMALAKISESPGVPLLGMSLEYAAPSVALTALTQRVPLRPILQ
jgi:hypothetical protein